MEDTKNTLPVAVYQVGGGEARSRSGGMVIPLDQLSNGSFSTGTATRIRVYANFRQNTDILLLISYTGPATLENSEYTLIDRTEHHECTGEPTTVYWRLIDIMTLLDRQGSTADHLCVTFYE